MTLEEAIDCLVNEFSIGDYIYDVRERAVRDGFVGNSWDHPKVLKFSQAVETLRLSLKKENV